MRDVYTRLMSGSSGIGPSSTRSREPRLAVTWEPRRGRLRSNLAALFRGPKPPRGFPSGPYFGGNWVRSKFPARAVLASAVIHVTLVVTPWPHWDLAAQPMNVAEASGPRFDLLWDLPARDLPPIPTAGPASKPSPPGELGRPLPRRGADAYHPRQTIISAPKLPTHPRQTLIQPDAPQIAPKILPVLPNIVQWTEAPQPAKPRMQINPDMLARLHPKAPVQRPQQDVALPDVPNGERFAGDINVAKPEITAQKPLMPVPEMSVPQAGPARTAPEVAAAAPEINPAVSSSDPGGQRLIALSATPGSDLKAPVPPGNLQAHVTISPEGTQPGTPGGAPNGTLGATGNAGGGPGSPGGTGGASGTKPGTGGGGKGAGIPGISISGGNPNATSSISGLGSGNGGAPRTSSLPAHPNPDPPAAPSPTRTPPTPGFERVRPGEPPESIFATRKVYTLHVNMPNLTSVTGSWVLSFVELPAGDAPDPPPAAQSAADLAGPVPLRKVDPKYPPALVQAHVEGEVVLYAIIRRDGSVDSIQVIKGLDPDLDANAMQALARWKFRPAERHGAPIELEAVVHIPFRAIAPNF